MKAQSPNNEILMVGAARIVPANQLPRPRQQTSVWRPLLDVLQPGKGAIIEKCVHRGGKCQTMRSILKAATALGMVLQQYHDEEGRLCILRKW